MSLLRIEPSGGLGPCPHCFESCGYEVEHGNDWNSGPWTHQTNIPCRICEGTGSVEMEDATDDELFEHFDDAFDALTSAPKPPPPNPTSSQRSSSSAPQ